MVVDISTTKHDSNRDALRNLLTFLQMGKSIEISTKSDLVT